MAELTLNWPSGPCRRRKISGAPPGAQVSPWATQFLEANPLTKKEKEKLRVTQQAFRGTIFDGTAYWIFEREGEAPPRPVHKCAVLYKRLMEERPDDFVSKFGFLWSRDESELVKVFSAARREIAKLVAAKKGDDWDAAKKWQEEHPQFMQLDGVIGEDEVGRPQYEFQPRHLCGLIVAQLIQDWSDAREYKFCKRPGCGEYFYYGAGTGHRKTAKYCSKKCNLAHAYQLRKEQVK